ncbi:MAG: ferrous iron transport protein B [Bacteroidetes bacterium]|nr:ferrous iron transport protein B [Bacteroidota bacterium]
MSKDAHTNVLLIGNPNAGKTTLFNALTGLHQKTGNYAGVTVDKYTGISSYNSKGINHKLSITDLPGTYSLFPKSLDEDVSFNYLMEHGQESVVVVVCDATNLKRNLLLATQVIDLKLKTVIALNFFDEVEKQNIKININALSEMLGLSLVAVNSRNGEGIENLKKAITEAQVSKASFYDINELNKKGFANYTNFLSQPKKESNNKLEVSDKTYRYSAINYLTAKHIISPVDLKLKQLSQNIDKIITHKIFGYVILLIILFLMFQSIFYIAQFPMQWIEDGFMYLKEFLKNNLPSNKISELLINGVISGISGVVIFIPQIALLFLFITILEDSGYMARASFILDKLMKRFGLNGKSVIPLISGTACAVPSIMATRTISNYKERIITIFILPLISCSARLPVYTLLISLMIKNTSKVFLFNLQGVMLMLMYALGFAMTLITAWILKKVIKNKENSFFIMELPTYRLPHVRNIFLTVINKVKIFVFDAGKIIVSISIILWILSNYGGREFNKVKEQRALFEKQQPLNDSVSNHFNNLELETSYIGTLGHVIEPVIKPLGFDWKIGIAIITSFAAREVFVGTMATIYESRDSENVMSIKEKLMLEQTQDGKPMYTFKLCLSLLLFYVFALQCMSTIATTKRETKSTFITIMQFVYMFALAYLSSFIAFNI